MKTSPGCTDGLTDHTAGLQHNFTTGNDLRAQVVSQDQTRARAQQLAGQSHAAAKVLSLPDDSVFSGSRVSHSVRPCCQKTRLDPF